MSASPILSPPPKPLPYGRQWIDDEDVAAVVDALKSEMIAQGPRVKAFEQAVAQKVGAADAVACASGTAALHLALAAWDVGPGDVCIVPAITFLATATSVRFCGADVRFADVDPQTGLITPQTVQTALGQADAAVKAVIPVHLGGRLCDMAGLQASAAEAGAFILEDASHAIGGFDAEGASVGACPQSSAATFSFHPVKSLAAGEGGMICTNDQTRSERMRRLRNHGVTHDPALMVEAHSLDAQGERNPWSYEQIELGFNYRMNELEAALGLSQLSKLDQFIARRTVLSDLYEERLAAFAPLIVPAPRGPGRPGLHLFNVLIDFDALDASRAELIRTLADQGVGTQVHYIPLYRQPYFKTLYGSGPMAGAEAYYARVLALPLFPAMGDDDVDRVVGALLKALGL